MTESTTEVKYPDIIVKLTGEDGNAFFILGRVRRIMKAAGIIEEYNTFASEATSGDYNHLISTVMRWFKVE